MRRKTPNPEWYVYTEDYNANTIKKFNVFYSINFLDGCKRTFKKYKDIKKIEEEIKAWARYSFWSKCEYEVVLNAFTNKSDFQDVKIDVYDQLMLNWDSFFQYIMDHKAFFLRREK